MSDWEEVTEEEFKRMVFQKNNPEFVDINVDPIHIKEIMFGDKFKMIEITNEADSIGTSTTTYNYYKKK